MTRSAGDFILLENYVMNIRLHMSEQPLMITPTLRKLKHCHQLSVGFYYNKHPKNLAFEDCMHDPKELSSV